MKKEDLGKFVGSLNFYSHTYSSLLYTEGVQYVAKNGGKKGAHWLIDAIAAYQEDPRLTGVQLWKLVVDRNKKRGTLTCNCNQDIIIRQDIKYTDFPLDEIEIYIEDSVMLLSSER